LRRVGNGPGCNTSVAPSRFISLTQKRLMDMISDGHFLDGLFYRLNTISITAL
jgi:DNA-binding NtrC family response regulator